MQPEQRETPQKNTNVVLQWISYGLWEWTLVALSVLLSATLTYYLVDTRSAYTFVVYFLAALLCLLPLAFFSDRWYAKSEPEQKHGFAGVVMVLNAVIVFLATIGGLITAVVSTLSVFVNTQTSAATHITIISSLVVTVLGLLLFVRILNPPKLQAFCRFFPMVVVAIAALTLIGVFAGPFKMQLNTRNDRFIEANVPAIELSVTNYVNDHRSLPSTLDELDLNSSYNADAKELVEKKLLRYTPNSKPQKKEVDLQTTTTIYYYELCMTWQRAKGDQDNLPKKDIYQITERHAAGDQCYELEAQVYKTNNAQDQTGVDIQMNLRGGQSLQ